MSLFSLKMGPYLVVPLIKDRHQIEDRMFLYLMKQCTTLNYLNFGKSEFIIDFFTFIFLTWISRLILDVHIPAFTRV